MLGGMLHGWTKDKNFDTRQSQALIELEEEMVELAPAKSS